MRRSDDRAQFMGFMMPSSRAVSDGSRVKGEARPAARRAENALPVADSWLDEGQLQAVRTEVGKVSLTIKSSVFTKLGL